MNYERIFEEIGQFGKWQRVVFFMGCLCSMVSAFLTLGFSAFIGFTPKFRCYIPECDGVNRNDATYNANYNAFAIPEWGCTDGYRKHKYYLYSFSKLSISGNRQ